MSKWTEVPIYHIDALEKLDGWLSPDGNLYDVEEIGHARFSFEAFKENLVDPQEWLDSDGTACGKLKDCGWTRLSYGTWDLPSRVTPEQRRFIKDWCIWNEMPNPLRRMPVTGFMVTSQNSY